MKVTIHLKPGEYARLKFIAQDRCLSGVEGLLYEKVHYELYVHEGVADKRKKSRTCARCGTLTEPISDYSTPRPHKMRAPAKCERCFKKLTAKTDPYVRGSKTKMGWAIGELFRLANDEKSGRQKPKTKKRKAA